ncbi:MAG: LexA family transcriptional regulator [Lachnospiraceae bacterium]|nr:LexA family transcriptional regulator [Lachnospiraceae bacterium]
MNNLKYFRKKAGKTQKDVADYLGLTQTAYGNYELGKRQINLDTLSKLADLYGVTADDIMGRGSLEDDGRHLAEQPEIVPEEEVMIPLVASLRCGPGTSGEPFCVIKKIPVPSSYTRRWGDNLQAVIAVGESMSPTIIPGDTLICRPGDDWIDGNVVSVNVDDCDMVKRIFRTHDGGIDLRSDNPKFEPMHFTPADLAADRVHVLGRVMIPIPKEL